MKATIQSALANANATRRERTLDIEDVAAVVKEARKARGKSKHANTCGGTVPKSYRYRATTTTATAYTTRRGTTFLLVATANAQASNMQEPTQSASWNPETNRRKLAEWLKAERKRLIAIRKGGRV